ncbi:MAG TPA: hypothetical protein VFH44_04965 [Solirubrobacterales bacterium]|nr:hypothetical protein [Solirubrobacterales bacterium]
MAAMLALAFLAPSAAVAATGAEAPRITIALLPPGTGVDRIAEAVPGIAPGVMSAGLGRVPAGQTYLDIGQGNRVFSSLYPGRLPPLYVTGARVPAELWGRVLERAADAPADIEPGLLAATLKEAGVEIAARPLAGSPAVIAADRRGRVERTDSCEPGRCPGVTVLSAEPAELGALADRLRPGTGDLLIAIERPPPERDLLAAGIAGAGFEDGTLTSDSTRMDGYVLATDLLPTILERYGIAVPDVVDGQPITAAEGGDVATVTAREARLSEVSSRRWEVLAVNLMIWLAAGLVLSLVRPRLAGPLLATLATAMALVPAILLAAAALEPSELGERLMVGAGAPLLAAAAIAALRPRLGRRAAQCAFAAAAALSIVATAIDVVAGSPLTALSLLGPNPGLGVRFFGIGNELEAAIGALLLLATGAAVTAAAPADPRRAVAIAAVVVTILAVLAFAPGRFGADVGAAITFPAGAAATVIVALRLGMRRAALVVAAPIVALAALVVFDLVVPGDSHLTRSVLSAGGLDGLGDVLDRRITLAAGSFPRYIESPFFIAALVAIVAAIVFRRHLIAWFAGRPAALAGTAGAIAATVVGTLANDSAALLLMVGTGYVAAYCGLAWASRPPGDRDTS